MDEYYTNIHIPRKQNNIDLETVPKLCKSKTIDIMFSKIRKWWNRHVSHPTVLTAEQSFSKSSRKSEMTHEEIMNSIKEDIMYQIEEAVENEHIEVFFRFPQVLPESDTKAISDYFVGLGYTTYVTNHYIVVSWLRSW